MAFYIEFAYSNQVMMICHIIEYVKGKDGVLEFPCLSPPVLARQRSAGAPAAHRQGSSMARCRPTNLNRFSSRHPATMAAWESLGEPACGDRFSGRPASTGLKRQAPLLGLAWRQTGSGAPGGPHQVARVLKGYLATGELSRGTDRAPLDGK